MRHSLGGNAFEQNAGIVDEDVELAELKLDICRGSIDAVVIGDVENQEPRVDSFAAQRIDGGLASLLLAAAY